jgi:hypothetical protein
MIEVIDFADKLLGLLPSVLAAGGDVLSIISNGRTALSTMKAEHRGPTEAEWADLNAQIDALMGQLKG